MSGQLDKRDSADKKRKKRTVKVAPARGRVSEKKINAAVKATKKKVSKKKAPAKHKTAGKRGRPKFAPDLDDVRSLAELQCTNEEMAGFFHVSVKTIERHRKDDSEFDEAVTLGKLNGKVSLRRAQMRKALSGNVSMLIWLGKNMLGQAEKVENRAVDKDGNDVQTHGVLVVPAAMSPDEWVKKAQGHATGLAT